MTLYRKMRYNLEMKDEKPKATSFRLSPRACELLEELSRALGISKTAVVEIAIRAMAKDTEEKSDGT